VQHGDDLHGLAGDPIGNDVGRAGDNELAGAGDPARPADRGKRPQALDGRPGPLDDARCGGRIVAAIRS
jgi:hypothetical protein